ncbi:MAG: CheR family methyltransferase [Burkholderiales bacterium]
MTDRECVAFLQAVLPRLGLRWAGYRKVHKLVCKRLGRRLKELGLPALSAYREFLEDNPSEWAVLEQLCHVPISRFCRDRGVFADLEGTVLPALAEAARARRELACWSAGCASGEEPYTLALLWRLRLRQRFPDIALRILATDADAQLLDRARTGCYSPSSLKSLPAELLAAAFVPQGRQLCIGEEFRFVEFLQQDLRQEMRPAVFDLILCRNSALTYFASALQGQVMAELVGRLRLGGALVIGIHESLPEGVTGLEPWPGTRAIYRRRT